MEDEVVTLRGEKTVLSVISGDTAAAFSCLLIFLL